jgi:hypothetical protein
MLENFMDKSAEVGVPRWRLFDVVETIQFELLRTIKKQPNG